MHGKLPFAEADRIVGIQTWDQESGDPDTESDRELRGAGAARCDRSTSSAAYRTLDRNLITDDGRAEPVRGVEISASAFQIAQVPPLLGRPLCRTTNAAARRRSRCSATTCGRRDSVRTRRDRQAIRLGKATYTVVGVMPAGFGLPSAITCGCRCD